MDRTNRTRPRRGAKATRGSKTPTVGETIIARLKNVSAAIAAGDLEETLESKQRVVLPKPGKAVLVRPSTDVRAKLEAQAKKEGTPLATYCLKTLSESVGVRFVARTPYFGTSIEAAAKAGAKGAKIRAADSSRGKKQKAVKKSG